MNQTTRITLIPIARNMLRFFRDKTSGRPSSSKVTSSRGCTNRQWIATRTSSAKSRLGLRKPEIISTTDE